MEKRRSLSSRVDFVAFWRDFFGEGHLSWRVSFSGGGVTDWFSGSCKLFDAWGGDFQVRPL